MSKITNIIITGHGYNDTILVEKIEKILPEISGPNSFLKFTRIDNHAKCSYAMECQIWICAINYLDVEEFKRITKNIVMEHSQTKEAELNFPISLQIFLKEDEDAQVKEHKVI